MKKLLLIASCAVLVMLGACKKSKDNSSEETTNKCLLTEIEMNLGNVYDSKYIYSYDGQGRVSTATSTANIRNGDSFYTSKYIDTYSYTSDKIVVTSKNIDDTSPSTTTYLLDEKSRIVASNNNTIYTYDSEGHLASLTETLYTNNKKQSYVIKYTWSNGNLIKKESFSSSDNTTTITTYQYKTNIKPSNFFNIIGNDGYALSKYFGKQPKNLVESEGTSTVYIYAKDDKGNVTSMTEINGGSKTEYKFKYSCK